MSYVVSLFFLAMSISPTSHVDFKKWPCRCVEFRGQGPYIYRLQSIVGLGTRPCVYRYSVPSLEPLELLAYHSSSIEVLHNTRGSDLNHLPTVKPPI